MHFDLIALAAPELHTPDLRAAVGHIDPADVVQAEHDHRSDAARRRAALERIAAILLETLNAPGAE